VSSDCVRSAMERRCRGAKGEVRVDVCVDFVVDGESLWVVEYVRDAIGAHRMVSPPFNVRRQFLDGLKRRTVAIGSVRWAMEDGVVAEDEPIILFKTGDNRQSESKSFQNEVK